MLKSMKSPVVTRPAKASLFRGRCSAALLPTSLCEFRLLTQSIGIGVSASVLHPAVKRLGIDPGTKTFNDPGGMTQTPMRNPGFEGHHRTNVVRRASSAQ